MVKFARLLITSAAEMNPFVDLGQYLFTCSRGDESKLSTRECFGKMLEAEFIADISTSKIAYWICFREEHKNALKLTRSKNGIQSKAEFRKILYSRQFQ